jgi:hypothetical protein
MSSDQKISTGTRAIAVAVGVATFMAIGTIALFGMVVSLRGDVSELTERVRTLTAQQDEIEKTVQRFTDNAKHEIDEAASIAAKIAVESLEKETAKQLSVITAAANEQMAQYPKKSALDRFRREVYGDMLQMITKQDATVEDLQKFEEPSDYEQYTRWAKSKGFLAGLREFEQDGQLRGVIVFMPDALRARISSASTDTSGSFSWE